MAGSFGGVDAMAVTPEEVAAWVEASTACQGLATKVEDEAAMDRVVTLLRGGREPVRAASSGRGGKGRTGSDPERPG